MWVLGVLAAMVAGPCVYWWWRALGSRGASEFRRAGEDEAPGPNDAVRHAFAENAWLMLPND